MTVDELLEEAAKLGGWQRTAGRHVRRGNSYNCDCPIEAVARLRKKNFTDIWDAALVLGMDKKTATKIINAADDLGQKCLRRKMLRAFGLSE